MDDLDRTRSLVTERDIDPEYGLFTEEEYTEHVPTAEEELMALNTDGYAASVSDDESFPDIPDADAITSDTPVDPASPPEEFHGTDLLNGVGAHPEEESDDSLE